jgi:hypothetical protein
VAFEPLQTGPAPKKNDMDTQMLFGCSVFLVCAFGAYGMSVWPWFVFQDAERSASVMLCTLIGILPTATLGMYMVKRGGLGAACGLAGGSCASAVFLYLRIQQAFMAYSAQQAPKPDYPGWVAVAVPAGQFLVVGALAGLAAWIWPMKADSDESGSHA